MTFKSRWLLKPGPTVERPITLVVESAQRDEDGSQAKLESDLTLEEALCIRADFEMAIHWVTTGAWKPTGAR